MSMLMDAASEELKFLKGSNKHWMCKGKRNVAAAATLLKEGKVIAIPTDTIYGLAVDASNTSAIEKLYDIKKRDGNKPLSISVSSIKDISMWGVTDHISTDLIETILPGPCTIILKRTPLLNPALNTNCDTVGIRVPNFTFINCVAQLVGPLALTSANVSSQPSCLYTTEFKDLWPMLGGIFHDSDTFGKARESFRQGSTIIDLTEPFCYKIVRYGVHAKHIISVLNKYGLQMISD